MPQFVVECTVSHFAFDDPIVLPGDAGGSHLHTFFGAYGVHAGTTYEDLLAASTSCDQRLDTASYWAPTLLADGRIVEPLRSKAYYRPGPGVDHTIVEPYPPGLKLLAGDAEARGPQPEEIVGWSCGTGADRDPEPESLPCPPGRPLTQTIVFPDCWDGERIDAADHLAHSAYSIEGACPPGAPVAIPQLLLAIEYPELDAGAELTLSSGSLHTAHADFWNGWDQDKLETEVRLCINRGVVCGLLG